MGYRARNVYVMDGGNKITREVKQDRIICSRTERRWRLILQEALVELAQGTDGMSKCNASEMSHVGL